MTSSRIRTSLAFLPLIVLLVGCPRGGTRPADGHAVDDSRPASKPTDRAGQAVGEALLGGACKRSDGGLLRVRRGCPPEFGEDVFGRVLVFESTLITQAAYHDCFPNLEDSGSSSSLPPESAKCGLGPDKRCEAVPEGEADEPWEYVLPTDSVWGQLELEPRAWGWADSLYKTIYWQRTEDTCIVEIQAWGDLNQDGIRARYSGGYKFPVGTSDRWRIEMASFHEQPGADNNTEGERPVLADWKSASD